MTLAGIIFMAISWGIIIFLVIFAHVKMLRKENVDKVGPRDVLG
ncbi:MAG: hypothetical protein N2490_00615 [Ignavibacteria bacterium]|nr:hypothetical protein [Ignavibacteria bacterium]